MKCLEIGCGQRPLPGYLHQDIAGHDGVDLDFACAPWEIPESGFDLIVAVGVMEHLRFEEFAKTIGHFLNILTPGGKFSFDVPDLAVWCKYYLDSCADRAAPFPQEHILRTLYGWQRWPGDEHKSGWSRKSLESLIGGKNQANSKFACRFAGPEIFTELGINRNRFARDYDAHLYVQLMKIAPMELGGTKP